MFRLRDTLGEQLCSYLLLPDTGDKVMFQTVLRDLLFLESDALLPSQLL